MPIARLSASGLCHILRNSPDDLGVVVQCCHVVMSQLASLLANNSKRTSLNSFSRSAKLEFTLLTRKWRNWQTHQLEGLALFGASGFKSPLPHQLLGFSK